MLDIDDGAGSGKESEKQTKARLQNGFRTHSGNAGKSSMNQLFFRRDFDGKELDEHLWRSEFVFCSITATLGVRSHSVPQGNSNLLKPLLDAHGARCWTQLA